MSRPQMAAHLREDMLDLFPDMFDGCYGRGRYVRQTGGGHLIQSANAECRKSCQSRISLGIWASDTTFSTAPQAIASFGMPNTTQLSSSWARVAAPSLRISSSPLAPSSPIPVMMMPSALRPPYCAADRNSTSAEVRCRDTGGPSLIAM